jgi:hypothetical protein
MSDEERIDPNHLRRRAQLRLVGVGLAIVGLLFTACGMVSFFSSFVTLEPPRYFWCAFVGLPVLFAGLAICQFAFLGSVSRFVAGESAPVQKDTFNYLAQGTQEGVRTIAKAVGEGLAATGVPCPNCRHTNEAAAKFCSNCGAALAAP